MARTTTNTTANNIQEKLKNWCAPYLCVFRANIGERRFADQEVELIRGKGAGAKRRETNRNYVQDETSSEGSQCRDYLNYGEEDEMEIEGYQRSRIRTLLTWLHILLTLGLLRLIFHWWPRLMLYATHTRCPIAKATKVLVIEQYQQKYKRYHVKTVFTISSDLFRTQTVTPLTSDGQSPTASLRLSDDDLTDFSATDTTEDVTFRNGHACLASSAATSVLSTSPGFLQNFQNLLINIISSFRTNKLFIGPQLSQDQRRHESCRVWDQQLEQELHSMDSRPKLAIPRSDGKTKEFHSVKMFACKKLRYFWDDEQGAFVKLRGLDNISTQELHKSSGLSLFEQCQRRLIYGDNEIKVEVKSIFKLLFLEVLNPFYVFQIFSVSLWLSDNYIYFSIAIIIMSVAGITSTIIQTRSNQQQLRRTVQSSDIVTICRGLNTTENIPTEHLVPGDVIIIPAHGCTMHCDAALLSGNCIVNESMLTGESVPVTKTPLPNRPDLHYSIREHARHTLFCGTTVMQTRYYGNEHVLAVVLRSGYLTTKGSLVRSIMYPPPVDYKFERDSYKFVGVLACIAGIGFTFSIITKVRFGETLRNIIVDSLDLITIVVPPALPAAMTVGRFYAQRRLQKKGIYCISPRAINVSGSIDCVCFDKTGTLTEDGLDLWGAVPCFCERRLSDGLSEEFARFQAPVRDVSDLSHGLLLMGMSVCHSLTLIDGSLIGDPLDLKMFEWTGWSLEEPGVADNEKFDMIAPTVVRPRSGTEINENNIKPSPTANNYWNEVGILRQFPFSSSLQRMSVITRTLGGSEFELFCKGSPEMIVSLSRKATVPKNFNAVLETYTQEGFRVIAIGHKKLFLNYTKAQRVLREEVETDLTFLGLIVLDNRLKPATTKEMGTLKRAGIRQIMVTGDNMLTALSVARECGMVEPNEKVIMLNVNNDESDKGKKPIITFSQVNKNPISGMQSPGSINSALSNMEQSLIKVESPANRYHFAVSGNAFSIVKTHYPELLPKILVRGTVFARMSPEQKQQLVELLQGMEYFVGMCGDGANDCGALKAAHAGISLSEAESSVASPFTSTEPNIKCVSTVIREGRAALVTSFGIFKYMAVYSLTQFVTVIILYTIQANLGDLQFLYIDLFLISVFALFFGHTEPYNGPLVKQPPSASLVSAPPIVSIICHMLAIAGIQGLTFLYVQQQSWFTAYEFVEDQYEGYENYTLFAISTFQYIIMAIVFSRGKPYRKPLVTNYNLLASLIILSAFTIYLVLGPCSWLVTNLELKLPPNVEFRFILVGFGLVNLLIACFIEYGIVNFIVDKNFGQERANSKKEHVRTEKELAMRTEWPPLNDPYVLGSEGSRSDLGGADLLNSPGHLKHSNMVFDETKPGRCRRHSITLTIPVPRPNQNSAYSKSRGSYISPGSEPPGGFTGSPVRNTAINIDLSNSINENS